MALFGLRVFNESGQLVMDTNSFTYANGRIMMYSLAFTAWTDQGHRPFLCAKLLA